MSSMLPFCSQLLYKAVLFLVFSSALKCTQYRELGPELIECAASSRKPCAITFCSWSCRLNVKWHAGIAASVLDAKLNRTQTAAWYCTRTADWRVVYFSFREALSPLCLCDELMVHYDEANNQYAFSIMLQCHQLCTKVQ